MNCDCELCDKKEYVLHQYIYERKRGKNNKKGVLFARKSDDGQICIGFSSCSPRDIFDKYFGFGVAAERSFKYCQRNPKKIPFSIQENLPKFINRCKRYFKTDKFPNWLDNINSELEAGC